MQAMPQSKLTLERPDIWARAMLLATSLTSMEYAPKLPLPDGTLYSCGYGGNYSYNDPAPIPAPPPTKEEKIAEIETEILDRENEIERENGNIERSQTRIGELEAEIKERRKEIGKLKRSPKLASASVVFVPEGAAEWLLHEVGHWVAATPEERRLPNYGYGSVRKKGWGIDREWQAWAFEEIILAPYAPARELLPPAERGGVAFSRIGPMPKGALNHAHRNLIALGIDIEQWRQVYGDWVKWGCA